MSSSEDEKEEVVRVSSSEEDEDEGEESDSGEDSDEESQGEASDSGEGEDSDEESQGEASDSGEGEDSDEENEESVQSDSGEGEDSDEENEESVQSDSGEGDDSDVEDDEMPMGDFANAANRARNPPQANNQRPRKRFRAGNGANDDRPCPYKQRCRAFLDSLDLNEEYFEASYDRCYCRSCAAAAGVPEVLETDRAHGCPYEVPIGWCGFGLKVKPTAAAEKVFEKWAVSFHGCPSEVISSILRQGELLIPGDKMIDGKKLPNRLTGGGSNRIGLYTSPSIKYSELDIYTKPRQWSGSSVRTVIQCRQKPGTFGIEGETIGWTTRFGAARFSRHFGNDRIERFTKARGSIIPYRVLVALDVTTREHEEETMLQANHPPVVPIRQAPAGAAAADGVLDLQVCEGNHWVDGNGGCGNEACRFRQKCVATCTRCPDRIRAEWRAVPLLQVCEGNHWVSGGCENEACRFRQKCVATCTRCPDRIRAEKRSRNKEECAVM